METRDSKSVRRGVLFTVAVIMATCGPGGHVASARAADVTLQGTGATFPAPLYQRWFTEYNKMHPEVQINYQALGSGAGVKQFQDGLVNFGASDAAMSDEEIAAVKDGVVLLPLTAGSIVLAYNLPGGPAELKLSREAYVGIFLGKITSWNDPKIASANPGATLPDLKITPVTRSDGSGTTFVFTQHLSAISDEWKSGPGTGKSVNFPVGVGGKGNPGVTALIKQTPGAIGYVEYGYAKQTQMPMATLENKSNKYVKVDPESEKAALASVELPADLRAWITDPAAATAYPIVTYTWLLAYKKYADPKIKDALKGVIQYGLTDGQKFSEELGYIPLPAGVVTAVTKALERIFLMGHPEEIDPASRWEVEAQTTVDATPETDSISRPPSASEIWGDRIFRSGTRLVAWAAVALAFYVVWDIARAAFPAMRDYGAGFLFGQTWDANKQQFGILPAIFGTLYTSFLGLAIGSAFGIAIAIFLSEGFLAAGLDAVLKAVGLGDRPGWSSLPDWIEDLLKTTVELLAAVPSVVYGLWGIFVVIPLVRPPANWLHDHLGWLPWFGTTLSGPGILPASLVLAIMVLPTISAVSRDALVEVPPKLREAAFGLGATRWEAILAVIVPTASTGILGAVILGFGRALGETMALAMLAGNANVISWSMLSPANTLAALLANHFPEAGAVEVGALMYAALVLLAITLVVNIVGTAIVQRADASLKGLR